MTVVLAYSGAPSKRQEAEAQLRRALPDAVLTAKTRNMIEAQVEIREVEQLVVDGCWKIVTPSYADIRQPSLNLKRLKAKLGRS